jgi:hypothetical protein
MSRGDQSHDKKHNANKNRKLTTTNRDPGKEEHHVKPIITGPSGQASYGQILQHKLEEFKRGNLYNASGRRVDRRNQAVNIARHEARLAGARDVPEEGKAEKTKREMQPKRTGLKKAA